MKPDAHFALTIEEPRRGGGSSPLAAKPKAVKPVQIALLPEAFHDPRQLTIDPRELARREAAEREQARRAALAAASAAPSLFAEPSFALSAPRRGR